MKITFVSHAGFITEVGGKSILTDPWTVGKAFNESWSLYAPAFEVDYQKIDYLFISHEHPDHFSLPTLKSISITERKRIKVLYQAHTSPRIPDKLTELGFGEIILLPLYCWTRIDSFECYCGSAGSMDSFLAIREGNQTILNLNDCVFNQNQYAYIKRNIGNVDVLLTQFSFANWVGNELDEMGAAKQKVKNIFLQHDIFKPSRIIPFASFVYFCNNQNARMNEWSNTPRRIAELPLKEICFLYPGDELEVGSNPPKSNEAVEKYMRDLNLIKMDADSPSVAFDEVLTTIRSHLETFKSKIPLPLRIFIRPFSIYLTDLNTKLSIDPGKAVAQQIADPNYKCRYEMLSSVCHYTFSHSWGAGTLDVSGMFRDNLFPKKPGLYFFLQNMISTGFIRLNSFQDFLTTTKFIFSKRWEIFYRYF